VTLERNILRDIAHVLHVLSEPEAHELGRCLEYCGLAAKLEKRLVEILTEQGAI
jgi:hypothetical protein